MFLSPANAAEPPKDTFVNNANAVPLDVTFDGKVRGKINAYARLGTYHVPLLAVVRILKFPITLDRENKQMHGWFIQPNRIFVLNAGSRELVVEGKQEKLRRGAASYEDGEIYVDAALLEKFFPVRINVDPSQGYLKIIPKEKFPGFDEAAEAANEKAAALEVKKMMPVEQVSEEESNARENKADSNNLDDDSLIIFQVMVGKLALENFIEAYSTSGPDYMISLADLSKLLEFPIVVSAAKSEARGWFIGEANTFYLNFNEGYVEIKGQKQTFKKGQVGWKNGALFVNTELLARWLSLTFSFDTSSLLMAVESQEKLPFLAKLEREKKLDKLKKAQKPEVEYKRIDTPYRPYSFPFFDVDLGSSYSSLESNFVSEYSMAGGGDLGYLSTQAFISGTSDESIDSARLNLGRKDIDGGLLGPLDATDFNFGDINSVSIPLIAATSLGRGAMVSNAALREGVVFDRINIVGDSTVSWDVELYRNDVLLDLQQVATDGRYEFLNIPLLYGNNIFRLVFYGPQGQIREEVRQYNIGDELLKKGIVNYSISVDEKSKSFLGTDDDPVRHSEDMRYVAQAQYGITDSVTGILGFASTPLIGGVRNLASSGLRTSVLGTIVSMDVAGDEEGEWGTKTTLVTGFDDISLKLEQRFYSDEFSSEENDRLTPLPSSITELDVGTSVPAFIVPYANISFNLKNESLESGERQTLENRLSTAVGGIGISNRIAASIQDSTDNYFGSLSLRGSAWQWIIRTVLDYTIRPVQDLERFSVSFQRNLTQKLTDKIDIEKGFQDNSTRIRNSLIWDLTDYKVSLEGEVDDQGETQVFARLGFSLARDPMDNTLYTSSKNIASLGAVSARTFVDNNQNKQIDKTDTLVDEALTYKVGSRTYMFDKGDTAFVTGVPTYQPTAVELNKASLPDPLWMPYEDGYSVVGRPGSITEVDFLLAMTSDIDGTVYARTVQDGQNFESTLSSVLVELVDAQGQVVKSVSSEFDGFFIFEKVLPGKYSLRVSAADLKKMSLVQENAVAVDITNNSESFATRDIFLREDGTTPSPNMPAAGDMVISMGEGDDAPVLPNPLPPTVVTPPAATTAVPDVPLRANPSGGARAVFGGFTNYGDALASKERFYASKYGVLLNKSNLVIEKTQETGVYRISTRTIPQPDAENFCRMVVDLKESCQIVY